MELLTFAYRRILRRSVPIWPVRYARSVPPASPGAKPQRHSAEYPRVGSILAAASAQWTQEWRRYGCSSCRRSSQIYGPRPSQFNACGVSRCIRGIDARVAKERPKVLRPADVGLCSDCGSHHCPHRCRGDHSYRVLRGPSQWQQHQQHFHSYSAVPESAHLPKWWD